MTESPPLGHSNEMPHVQASALRMAVASDPDGARAEPPPPVVRVALDFDAVYAAQFEAVTRCLLSLGVPEASIEDALQDVFVVVHRRLGEFEGRSSLKTWVLAIAVRVAHDYRRALRRKGGGEPLSEEITDAAPAPDEVAAQSEALGLMARLLDQLDPLKRTAFVLAEIEQMTAPEIADVLAVPVNTVYSRIRLARREFEALLARHTEGLAR